MKRNTILQGDALEILKTLPNECVHCIITSPPYYGLRDYEVEGQIGLEETPQAFIGKLVEVFREARRVLRKDGVLWCNIGDSYAGSWGNYSRSEHGGKQRHRTEEGKSWDRRAYKSGNLKPPTANVAKLGYKAKDLMMIPARLAIALQDDGWYLRQDCIWWKISTTPESVLDRPSSAHEHVFLFAKSDRYYYDSDAVRQPLRDKTKTTYGTMFHPLPNDALGKVKAANWHGSMQERKPRLDSDGEVAGANLRNVWPLASEKVQLAHFATFPSKLVEICLLAGTSPQACETCGAPWRRVRVATGHVNTREAAHAANNTPTKTDSTGWKPMMVATSRWEPTCPCSENQGTGKCLVLDPFCGAGTVPKVALKHQRDYLGIELNPTYIDLISERIEEVQPVLWLGLEEVS